MFSVGGNGNIGSVSRIYVLKIDLLILIVNLSMKWTDIFPHSNNITFRATSNNFSPRTIKSQKNNFCFVEIRTHQYHTNRLFNALLFAFVSILESLAWPYTLKLNKPINWVIYPPIYVYKLLIKRVIRQHKYSLIQPR